MTDSNINVTERNSLKTFASEQVTRWEEPEGEERCYLLRCMVSWQGHEVWCPCSESLLADRPMCIPSDIAVVSALEECFNYKE